MRLFFALWPPRETAEALAAWAGGLDGKKTPAEKIHLTLAFLGDAEPGKAIAAARQVRAAPFELQIDSARYVRDNHMVWVGPRAMPDGLRVLAEGLQLALYRAEFILEHRPFAAHVTLARKARRPASMPPLPTLHWPVRAFALADSNLSRYEVLARFRLAS